MYQQPIARHTPPPTPIDPARDARAEGLRERVRALLAERRPGFGLPRDLYLDEALFGVDQEAVFATEWLFACNACEIREPGDYLTLQVAGGSVVVLRDREGAVRAFHNTCRHRGSRICLHETGRANRLVCPYHQWVYELDGRLIDARQMPADFDPAGYGLKPAHCTTVAGLVYVSIARTPPSIEGFRAAVEPFIAPHRPDRTKVAHVSTIVEEANWKLVIENNRECYHCAANHPELLVTLVEFALPDDPRASAQFDDLMSRARARWDALDLPHRPADGGVAFRCIRLPFNEGGVSFTLDGGPACRKLLGDFVEPDLGSVRMFRAPNAWHHVLADHILHFRVTPLSADRTEVRTTWLVHEDAVEGVDYDVERLTAVWTATNDQDRVLAENNHAGIRSRAYEPGPYAPSEFMLTAFSEWYAGKLAAYADAP